MLSLLLVKEGVNECRMLTFKFITMKNNLKGIAFWRRVLALALLLPVGGALVAQDDWSQAEVCPGWNNPTSFTTGANTLFYYSGQIGEKLQAVPNIANGYTAIDWNGGTHATLTNSQMNTYTYSYSYSTGAVMPGTSVNRMYYILSTTTQCSGHPVNSDPNTGDNLPYVPSEQFNTIDTTGMTIPTELTHSIRIGDGQGDARATALYYNMHVTSQNAMLYLYYAIVVQQPHTTVAENPNFIIRVMKTNDAGNWVQASPTTDNQTHCDTLTYMVGSTLVTNGGTVVIGQDGWHQYGGNSTLGNMLYKDWVKVSINLTPLLGQDIRIEAIAGDCCWSAHCGYAYICGECRPMSINSSGCAAGRSTNVTTLSAPRGLDRYVWYASEHGKSNAVQNFNQPDNNPNSTRYYKWRLLSDTINSACTEDDSAYLYRPQAADFRIHFRPNSAHNPDIPASPDSVGDMQAFRCEMTSAIDPSKPFKSNLYVNVQNTKPTMDIDSLSVCGGDVQLVNKSYVPQQPNKVNLDATEWFFYNNPLCLGTADTSMVGESAAIHYDDGEMKGVRVVTYNHLEPDEANCYSEAIYPVRPLPNPVGGMTISQRVLCDDDPTILADTTYNSTYRVWRFRDTALASGMELTDTLVGMGEQNRTLTRSFTHGVEPIELMVRNGLFYVDPSNTLDTIWCSNTLYDTVAVFLHPELEVLGDTIVCQGNLTDATVNAIGVDSCVYQWSTSLNSITGNLLPGAHLGVVPYADTSTYYVRVTSEQGCVAWDSIHAYLVVPQLQMIPADGRICPGDSVYLIGSHAHHYTWSASPDDASMGWQDSMPSMVVTPQKTTTYTLVGHGSNDCDASPLTATVNVFPYPVPKVDLDPGIVDSEMPTITMYDHSPYSVSSTWIFDAGETATGSEVTHTFTEATGADSVYVTLIAANELGCETVYPFSIPVNLYTAWFPNVFTPGSEDENSRFRLYTINAYEHFHIYIYNRRGELVFDSADPSFEWDGTCDGRPCQQGSYVYICRFRKPGTYNLVSQYGNVTLVR